FSERTWMRPMSSKVIHHRDTENSAKQFRRKLGCLSVFTTGTRLIISTTIWHRLLPAASLSRRVVSLSGTHLVLLVVGEDFDLAVFAIGSEVCRLVGDVVLAP